MWNYKNYDVVYDYCDEEQIKNLLLFRKIVEVKGDTLILDNGIELDVVANEGCGGCSNGWYYLTELNGCDNVITNVEFNCDDYDGNDEYYETSYKIFVYAENKKIKILQVDGSDGNGYYGTGYSIYVKIPKAI